MDDAQKLALLFQTLSDANRLRIIKFIGARERSVTELVEATELSQPLVSHHLKILRESQILETNRKGPFIYYKLKDLKLLIALGLFSEIFGSLQLKGKRKPMFQCPPWWNKC